MVAADHVGLPGRKKSNRGYQRMLASLVTASAFSFLLATSYAQTSRGVTVVPEAIRQQIGFDRGESAGLFVGISSFDDRTFAEVPYAVDDAVDLAHLFSVKLDLIAPSRVILSLSGEPQNLDTRRKLQELKAQGAKTGSPNQSAILRLLSVQSRSSGARGVFVLSIAAHGFNDRGADYLVAADSQREFIQVTGLPVANVLDQVSRAKAGRRIVLLDACRERLNAGRRAGGADPESAMGQAFQEAIATAGGQVILAGSTTGGYAYDDDRLQNGVFSAAVMEGLQGRAEPDEEGLVKVKSLAKFVNARVRQWVVDNRPADVNTSKGITVNLEGRAADLPLAVSAERLQALEAYRTRCRAALVKLRQNLNGFITGALYDEISQFLSCEDPGTTQDGREELLTELEQLDGTSRSQRILVDYYRPRRDAFLAGPGSELGALKAEIAEVNTTGKKLLSSLQSETATELPAPAPPPNDQTQAKVTSLASIAGDQTVETVKPRALIDNGDGTVTDSETGLMWTKDDKGSDIHWNGAKKYCWSLTLAGYSDWRLPTIEELEALHDPSVDGRYEIRRPFHLTDEKLWSSTPKTSRRANYFNFGSGGRSHDYMDTSDGWRALCVHRSGE